MATEITNLELEELSLVGKGANQFAKAPIFKADTPKGENMTEEVEKMSEEMDKKVKDYMKRKGCDRKTAESALMKSVDENETLRKALIDEGYVINADGVTKKAPEEFIEYEGEKVAKSDIPAPILKHLETLEKEQKDAAVAKAAKETLPNFKEDAAIALMKADLPEDVLEVLRAADKLFEGLTEEVGKQDTQGDMTDPNEKMNELAKKYAEENNVTKAQGYTAVSKTEAGKALLKAIYKKED